GGRLETAPRRGEVEPRAFGADDRGAGEEGLQALPGRVAVTGGEEQLVGPAQGANPPQPRVAAGPPRERMVLGVGQVGLAQIPPTGERASGAGKDHDSHLFVVARTPDPGQQVALERDRERVHLLGAVQPDERNLRPRLLVLDQHVPPCGEAAWRRSEPRSTLPDGVSGSESTNSMRRGYW